MTTPQKDSPIIGIFFVIAAFFLFTTMSMFNKTLTGIHHPAEIMFYRSLTGLIPCTIFLLAARKKHLLKTKKPFTIGARVITGMASLTLTLAATQALPMSTASTLFFVSTLLTPIFAIIFLKERVAWQRWLAIAIGLTGVIIVAKPSLAISAIGVMMALLAGTGHATVNIILRRLKTENAFTITYYFFLGSTLLLLPIMPFIATKPDTAGALTLIAIGITGGLGQYMLTRGYARAEASLLAPFIYSGLIWSLFYDITLFNLHPTWTTLCGASLIIAANLWVAYRENKKS